MRLSILIFLFSFLLICCRSEPSVPVSKPVKFSKKEYAQNIIKARDSMRNVGFGSANPANQHPKSQNKEIKRDSLVKAVSPDLTPEPSPDTIRLKIAYGKSVIDTSKLAKQKVIFEFNSDSSNFLNLKVTPADSTANLRISQIIAPNGNSDGPFGNEIKYPITEKGVYRVLVSEDLMNGEPYSGKFNFQVKLGW